MTSHVVFQNTPIRLSSRTSSASSALSYDTISSNERLTSSPFVAEQDLIHRDDFMIIPVSSSCIPCRPNTAPPLSMTTSDSDHEWNLETLRYLLKEKNPPSLKVEDVVGKLNEQTQSPTFLQTTALPFAKASSRSFSPRELSSFSEQSSISLDSHPARLHSSTPRQNLTDIRPTACPTAGDKPPLHKTMQSWSSLDYREGPLFGSSSSVAAKSITDAPPPSHKNGSAVRRKSKRLSLPTNLVRSSSLSKQIHNPLTPAESLDYVVDFDINSSAMTLNEVCASLLPSPVVKSTKLMRRCVYTPTRRLVVYSLEYDCAKAASSCALDAKLSSSPRYHLPAAQLALVRDGLEKKR